MIIDNRTLIPMAFLGSFGKDKANGATAYTSTLAWWKHANNIQALYTASQIQNILSLVLASENPEKLAQAFMFDLENLNDTLNKTYRT